MSKKTPWILQLCHSYTEPFMDCARQYSTLFKDTPYKVCTVYLTGTPDQAVATGSASDEVIFLNYSSKQVRGLKFAAIRDIHRIAKNKNFKACIAHRFKPIYIALLATKLPVFGVHHAFGDYERATRGLFVNFYQKRLTLLAVSNAVRDDLVTALPKWSTDNIATVYNRINIEEVQRGQLSRQAAREALKLPQDSWIIGNVGRLHSDKDQTTLIKGFAGALKELPQKSLLVIMGSGRLEKTLKELVIQLNISKNVYFLGQVPNGRNYFKAFDVFALTSDHEPFGMVLLEAMAAGVPIIATACGGAMEVVDGVGTTFPLGDIDALAQGLIQHCKLDSNQLQLCTSVMASRLNNYFSDVVITQQFWCLTKVSSLLDIEKKCQKNTQ